MAVPTYSYHEERMQEFIINFAKEKGLPYKQDAAGNIYIIKGELEEGEHYPCVVSHIDTVHADQQPFILKDEKLIIRETTEVVERYGYVPTNSTTPVKVMRAYKPGSTEFSVQTQTGIGGDDKCGVFICMEMIQKLEKGIAAFFVSEEVGCIGSKQADPEVFEKVGYAIQFDAPGDNWVSERLMGINLYTEDFLAEAKDILDSYGITKYSSDPFTDVVELKKSFDFNCFNIFAGYENMHTKTEFIVLENIEKAINLTTDLIQKWGNKKWEYEYVYVAPTYNYGGGNYGAANYIFDDLEDMSLAIDNAVLRFRAWIPDEEKMVYNIGFLNGDIIYIDNGNWLTVSEADVVVMQSTGKLDNQGNEVYVGDVVDDGIYRPELIKNVAGVFIGITRSKKLGNIFEDPELELQIL